MFQLQLLSNIWQSFQQTKDFVRDSVQQAGDSLKSTATQATGKAIDTVNTTFEQAKTSITIPTAITSPMSNWLAEHPTVSRLVQILNWATNHPIISVIILIFALSIVWSIIKAIARLIESASWSIVQVPFKLIQALIKVSFLSFSQASSFAVKQVIGNNIVTLPPENFQTIHQAKQQRLAEIAARLEAIQEEQQGLLQEVATILADTNDITKMV
ncbi:MAG: hypothetical protein KME60_19245 [Cyanomargarita calcarea GSE-NOS-MK-12-04C]|jgi:hypothetical protein|uniref:Uncharacterized protein n=1 Tax=Cyanomargarita calcarea GSE-NOS-MK-12-04C TaxID=2839659 RepID=A0A951QQX6_9CYAN|nr:hypothetical protein [Cyanomargarita calcarea GSE-NOS-MK-12-04C]